jgi:hypothetical protein
VCFLDQEVTNVTKEYMEELTFPICEQSIFQGQKECLVEMEAWYPTNFTGCTSASKERKISSLALPVDPQHLFAISTAANSSAEVPVYVSTVPIFEYYDNVGMDHEYTTRSTPQYTWVTERTAFSAFNQPVSSKLVKPIYQQHLNTPNATDYLYTTNATARDTNWTVDFVVFYAYTSEVPGSVPIYEHYRANGQDHMYSKDETPFDSGWIVSPQVAFYAFLE